MRTTNTLVQYLAHTHTERERERERETYSKRKDWGREDGRRERERHL